MGAGEEGQIDISNARDCSLALVLVRIETFEGRVTVPRLRRCRRHSQALLYVTEALHSSELVLRAADKRTEIIRVSGIVVSLVCRVPG